MEICFIEKLLIIILKIIDLKNICLILCYYLRENHDIYSSFNKYYCQQKGFSNLFYFVKYLLKIFFITLNAYVCIFYWFTLVKCKYLEITLQCTFLWNFGTTDRLH